MRFASSHESAGASDHVIDSAAIAASAASTQRPAAAVQALARGRRGEQRRGDDAPAPSSRMPISVDVVALEPQPAARRRATRTARPCEQRDRDVERRVARGRRRRRG